MAKKKTTTKKTTVKKEVKSASKMTSQEIKEAKNPKGTGKIHVMMVANAQVDSRDYAKGNDYFVSETEYRNIKKQCIPFEQWEEQNHDNTGLTSSNIIRK